MVPQKKQASEISISGSEGIIDGDVNFIFKFGLNKKEKKERSLI